MRGANEQPQIAVTEPGAPSNTQGRTPFGGAGCRHAQAGGDE